MGILRISSGIPNLQGILTLWIVPFALFLESNTIFLSKSEYFIWNVQRNCIRILYKNITEVSFIRTQSLPTTLFQVFHYSLSTSAISKRNISFCFHFSYLLVVQIFSFFVLENIQDVRLDETCTQTYGKIYINSMSENVLFSW